ncbi:hypothetical protein K474DRAFT_468007 [Panus rudis PR-1116 ss-1]|nr:hypothetical protein K474DRAFT_468007 [Panus rudis PR-1116 ss-1]
MVRQSSPVQKAHKKKAQTGTRSSRSRVSSHAAASKVPPNDFILFRRDYFPKYPWMPFIERNVHLGKVWAELPREERLHYAELAAEARREHEKLNPIVKVAPKYSKGKKACQPKASAVASDAQQQSGVQHCSPSTPISPLSPTMPTSSQLPTSSEGAVDTNQLLESALSQLSINPLEAMYDHAQPGYAQVL